MIGLLGQIWLWLLLSFMLGAAVGIILTNRTRRHEHADTAPETSEPLIPEEDGTTTRVTPVSPPARRLRPASDSPRTPPHVSANTSTNTLPRNTNQSHNRISWPTEADQYQWPTERDLPSRQQRPE